MVGRKVSHYKITEKLGEGGMGVVYKAEDTQLRRTVALKFLSSETVGNEEVKARLIREAQASASLDHPNICAVHGIHEEQGQTFIAMAFIDGPALADKIKERPLPLGEALSFAIQIAEGLQEAHEKGIVHRDIKPHNVMLTSKGQVKIMDFGLASLAGRSKLTKSGTTLGTPAYMAPEQLEGRDVDRRADIWSLGCVLYEMLTRRTPFAADYEQAIAYGILNEQAEPVTALRSGLPTELDRIFDKVLAKDSTNRYQHADELIVDLRRLKDAVSLKPIGTTQAVEPPQGGPARPRTWTQILPGLVAGASLVALAVVLWPGPETPSPSTKSRAMPLTSYPGRESFPTFSPEGDRVAFAWEGENRENWDIYVKLIGENSRARLTTDPADDLAPVWAPDGKRIAFVRREPVTQAASIMLIPSIGGTPRTIVETLRLSGLGWNQAARPIAWHPDSRHLIVELLEPEANGSALHVFDVDTGSLRPLFPPESYRRYGDPAVSPDGRLLAFKRKSGSYATAVHVVGLTESIEADGEPRKVSGDLPAFTPAWSHDGKYLVFAAGRTEGTRLWRVDPNVGDPQPIVQPSLGAFPAFSPSGNRATYALITRKVDIWRASLPGMTNQRPLIVSTFFDATPAYSPDGSRIAFSSSRSGYREIWVCDGDGSNPIQLTRLESELTSMPYWSPDGSRLVFHSFVGDQREIFVVAVAGGAVERLTNDPSHDSQPTRSRDGEWIYFTSTRSGNGTIWKIPSGGGDPTLVTTEQGFYAVESLDGQTLFLLDNNELQAMPVGGGESEVLVQGDLHADGIWLVREGIYMTRDGRTALDFYDFSSRKTRRVFEFPEIAYSSVSVTPDGKTILYAPVEPPESDIMLLDDFR